MISWPPLFEDKWDFRYDGAGEIMNELEMGGINAFTGMPWLLLNLRERIY